MCGCICVCVSISMFYCMLNSIFIITFALMFSHFLLPLELNIVYKMIFEKYIENILFRLWNIREIAHLFVENMKNERNHSKHLLPAHSSLLLEITNEREIEIYEIMNMVTVRFIQRFMLDSLMIFFSSMLNVIHKFIQYLFSIFSVCAWMQKQASLLIHSVVI